VVFFGVENFLLLIICPSTPSLPSQFMCVVNNFKRLPLSMSINKLYDRRIERAEELKLLREYDFNLYSMHIYDDYDDEKSKMIED
jgi:hypothetical protein